MFSNPELQTGQDFPPLPYEDPKWQELTGRLAMRTDPASRDDILTEYTRYGIGWVERLPDYYDPFHDEPVNDADIGSLLGEVGLVHEIDPKIPEQDFVLVDGGNSSRYDIRLTRVKALQTASKLITPQVVVFGGQCPRSDRADSFDNLERRAEAVRGDLDSWAEGWLSGELSLSSLGDDRWLRSFATERELALLSLLKLHGRQLRHIESIPRPNAAEVRIDPSIPLASIAANVFTLDDQTITVLNAPARWREHAGRKLPVEEARPNGRSCFKEWLDLHEPPEGSRVILMTHQPNIYRSWLDIILKAREEGRSDLRITAAGARLESEATVGDVLEGLGNLIVNNYNRYQEGGVDIPPSTPFIMRPRYHA